MRKLLILGISCATVTAVAVGLILYGSNFRTFANTSDTGTNSASELTAIPNAIITGTGDVPIYPGAQAVSVTVDEGFIAQGAIEYHANLPNATLEEAATFYKKWLAENDWVITRETSRQTLLSMDVIWRNKVEGPPTQRKMQVSIQTTSSGRTELHFRHYRWPDVDKIPLMPGAQQVHTSLEKHTAYNYIRVTTYLVDITPAAAKNYYKTTLPEYGWGETLDEYHLVGTAFRGKGSTIVLTVEPTSSGQTLVKLQVYGTGIMPPVK
jgi:hypothetical protein